MTSLIAIDPGNEYSGICLINAKDYKPLKAGKVKNEILLKEFVLPPDRREVRVVIEMIGHYGTGMPAGKSVFDTCIWIGRFIEWFVERGVTVETLPRPTIKAHLCNSVRAKDSNVRQALVDRFAPGQKNYAKGTKKNPGYFYGFASDAWQAYALGVVYLDQMNQLVSGDFSLLYPAGSYTRTREI